MSGRGGLLWWVARPGHWLALIPHRHRITRTATPRGVVLHRCWCGYQWPPVEWRVPR